MKKIIFTALLLSTTLAFADYPRPPEERASREVKIDHITGDAAAALWETMSGKEIRGNSEHVATTSYKVMRTKDGLDQVICVKSVSRIRERSSVDCTTQSSQDGEKLEIYVMPKRLG